MKSVRVFILIILIVLCAPLLYSCAGNRQTRVRIAGYVYKSEPGITDRAQLETIRGFPIYYNGQFMAVSNERGEFVFYIDDYRDINVFLNGLTTDREDLYVLAWDYENRKYNMRVDLLISDKNAPTPQDNNQFKPEIRVAGEDETAREFSGLIKGVDYMPVSGKKVFFGENLEYAATTDENGWFSFKYINSYACSEERVIDYLSLESDLSYRAIRTGGDMMKLECLIVAADKDSEIDLANDVTYDFYVKCTFGQDGVKLPAGYQTRELICEEGNESYNGETYLVGVEVYAGDQLIAVSNPYGIVFDYLVHGTSIKFIKNGFSFDVRYFEMSDDIYTFSGDEIYTLPESERMLHFQGYTEDFDILLND